MKAKKINTSSHFDELIKCTGCSNSDLRRNLVHITFPVEPPYVIHGWYHRNCDPTKMK